ncbi:hypothetical protein BCR44DRAFT_1239144 [Catenaria anguillulae PL171]|uniref:Secreted protein n=1 Tax=Catenaria anguillulae PL171 TaxID=765915 RepID=A0A1Y2HD19_9FUNG|nr:hypothetical protein BCR44DRAFT_1239144 [Catenaria anguillulae PL171]
MATLMAWHAASLLPCWPCIMHHASCAPPMLQPRRESMNRQSIDISAQPSLLSTLGPPRPSAFQPGACSTLSCNEQPPSSGWLTACEPTHST